MLLRILKKLIGCRCLANLEVLLKFSENSTRVTEQHKENPTSWSTVAYKVLLIAHIECIPFFDSLLIKHTECAFQVLWILASSENKIDVFLFSRLWYCESANDRTKPQWKKIYMLKICLSKHWSQLYPRVYWSFAHKPHLKS